MRRINVPNIILIIGKSGVGKTTFARYLSNAANTILVSGDKLFNDWCDLNRCRETDIARKRIQRNFHVLSEQMKRAFHEYATKRLMDAYVQTGSDIIAEGWLFGLLPEDLQVCIKETSTLYAVRLEGRYAYSDDFKTRLRKTDDYPKIKKRIYDNIEQRVHSLLGNIVKEDYLNPSAADDAIIQLMDMVNKRVLITDCSTGYLCVQASKSGAEVYGIDVDEETLRVASIITNGIYHAHKVKYFLCYFYDEGFPIVNWFDYIVLTTPIRPHEVKVIRSRFGGYLNRHGKLIFHVIEDGRTDICCVGRDELGNSECQDWRLLKDWLGVDLNGSYEKREQYEFSRLSISNSSAG